MILFFNRIFARAPAYCARRQGEKRMRRARGGGQSCRAFASGPRVGWVQAVQPSAFELSGVEGRARVEGAVWRLRARGKERGGDCVRGVERGSDCARGAESGAATARTLWGVE